MKPIFEKWAQAHLYRPRIAVHFMYFLEQVGAVDIRFDGLVWLQTAARKSGEELWSENHAQDRMISLLETCWRTQRSELPRNQKAFESFKELLTVLADHQNHVALQLLDQIAERKPQQ